MKMDEDARIERVKKSTKFRSPKTRIILNDSEFCRETVLEFARILITFSTSIMTHLHVLQTSIYHTLTVIVSMQGVLVTVPTYLGEAMLDAT